MYTCGWNNSGQLGQTGEALSDPSTRGIPTLVDFHELEDENGDEIDTIVRVAAGTRHTACISQGGRCWAWGWNKFGQVAATDPRVEIGTPLLFTPGENVNEAVSLWAGPWATLVLMKI